MKIFIFISVVFAAASATAKIQCDKISYTNQITIDGAYSHEAVKYLKQFDACLKDYLPLKQAKENTLDDPTYRNCSSKKEFIPVTYGFGKGGGSGIFQVKERVLCTAQGTGLFDNYTSVSYLAEVTATSPYRPGDNTPVQMTIKYLRLLNLGNQ